MAKKYVMAIDQGTTSGRILFFDENANVVSMAQKEITQIYPQAGWVEQNPMEIWVAIQENMAKAMSEANIKFDEIASIGVTNWREGGVVWKKDSGEPVYNALVWQCRRSLSICEQWQDMPGFTDEILQVTGSPTDPSYSASKIVWILRNVPGAAEEAAKGNLAWGNIDTWIIHCLTKGKVHATECGNASSNMMYDLHNDDWAWSILDRMGIPASMMPEIKPSCGIMGYTDPAITGGVAIPIAGDLGDQQAGTFAQRILKEGDGKLTYGTAGIVDINIGNKALISDTGLTTRAAWKLGADAPVDFLYDTVIVGAGVIQWLRDGLGIIKESADSSTYAAEVDTSAGLYVVPALAGLIAPHWDPYARGTIFGITGATTYKHICRATLEGIAYGIKDCVDAAEKSMGKPATSFKVDGGACRSDYMMQFQADILGVPLYRPTNPEMTALGCGLVAGVGVGFWSLDDLERFWTLDRAFEPRMSEDERQARYAGWQDAVSRVKGWTKGKLD